MSQSQNFVDKQSPAKAVVLDVKDKKKWEELGQSFLKESFAKFSGSKPEESKKQPHISSIKDPLLRSEHMLNKLDDGEVLNSDQEDELSIVISQPSLSMNDSMPYSEVIQAIEIDKEFEVPFGKDPENKKVESLGDLQPQASLNDQELTIQSPEK